jgi:hypothetical protein
MCVNTLHKGDSDDDNNNKSHMGGVGHLFETMD